MSRDAAARLQDILVIGEAVRGLPQEVTSREPEVPWARIIGMRNRLAHEYFALDLDVVLMTVRAPLEDLREACLRLLID